MIRKQSNCITNIVKRFGTINGLTRPSSDYYDLKWFTLASVNQDTSRLLDSRILPRPLISKLFSDLREIKCWQCGDKIVNRSLSISCSNCLAPQLGDQRINYFTIFDQFVTYDVDISQIRKKYLNLQWILHPDKFTNRPEKDQQISMDLSTYVNKAYRVLINPYERGIYLLQLKGNHREEIDGNYIMDPEFLEEMLTINEAVIESEIQDLQKIRADVEKKVNTLVNNVSKGFQSNTLKEVELSLNKLKFYVNILDKITEKE
ncbi:iron-sulfur cluster co-chaperone protein HscB-like [Panonychus citri]|uniref:iron-sulfur cluster co-chaperone protein HscB-like n=1 Tax=Panonychus citri TaxID=50023 RepID=UPI002307EC40|nr:iron-sulfur cluster co-chaperone protein HscB-like [Panonychus citri]XP_053214118.1 iron-sulfur cluster co-chaperone protein HscB-like [Panonychus citri]